MSFTETLHVLLSIFAAQSQCGGYDDPLDLIGSFVYLSYLGVPHHPLDGVWTPFEKCGGCRLKGATLVA
jgi:hypothetical protein